MAAIYTSSEAHAGPLTAAEVAALLGSSSITSRPTAPAAATHGPVKQYSLLSGALSVGRVMEKATRHRVSHQRWGWVS